MPLCRRAAATIRVILWRHEFRKPEITGGSLSAGARLPADGHVVRGRGNFSSPAGPMRPVLNGGARVDVQARRGGGDSPRLRRPCRHARWRQPIVTISPTHQKASRGDHETVARRTVWLPRLSLQPCPPPSPPILAADRLAAASRTCPYVPPSVFSWTGFYVGTHLGYGWSDVDWEERLQQPGRQRRAGRRPDRLQLAEGRPRVRPGGRRVLELGGRRQRLLRPQRRLDGVRARPPRRRLLRQPHPAVWNGRRRLGRHRLFGAHTFSGYSKTHFGWVVGGGLEHMLSQNLTARVEYLYYDFNDSTAPAGALDAGVDQRSTRPCRRCASAST